MVGIISPFMVAGLLMANPAGFTFDGPEVTARTVGNIGYFTQGASPYTDLFERGSGTVQFTARERIADPRATYGDSGRLEATFVLGATTYRVEMNEPGFAPTHSGLPSPPAQPIAGGVVVNQELHGGAALGTPTTTRVHAAAAMWGVGRLWRNGQLLTDTALIHAAALDRGSHADDDTFRVLPVARQGDAEVTVLVWNIPRNLEPRGFIQFDFDDVAISVNGLDQPVVAALPSAGAFVGVAPPSTPIPGGVFLGGVATSVTSQPGTGGSGSSSGTASVADQQPVVAQGFLNADRVTINSGTIPTDVSASSTNTATIADSFQNPQRSSLSSASSTQPAFPTLQSVPDGFENSQRVNLDAQRAPPTLNGFVPLTSTTSVTPSTQGSYSVTPLVTGVAGPEFAFGGDRVTAGTVTTPAPLSSRAVAVPFIATPQPLNGQSATPFVSTPQTINGTGAVPFIATPQPLGAQSLSATPPGAVPPAATGFR